LLRVVMGLWGLCLGSYLECVDVVVLIMCDLNEVLCLFWELDWCYVWFEGGLMFVVVFWCVWLVDCVVVYVVFVLFGVGVFVIDDFGIDMMVDIEWLCLDDVICVGDDVWLIFIFIERIF